MAYIVCRAMGRPCAVDGCGTTSAAWVRTDLLAGPTVVISLCSSHTNEVVAVGT